jgi:hypothetical protein
MWTSAAILFATLFVSISAGKFGKLNFLIICIWPCYVTLSAWQL